MTLDDLRPGWRTELVFSRVGMDINLHDDCVVLRTPGNPSFYWGNYLLLAQPPRDEDLAFWLARFETEISQRQPESRHVAIGVNTVYQGQQLPAWDAAGLKMHVNAVLHIGSAGLLPAAPVKAAAVQVRPVDWARDIPAVLDLECADVHGFDLSGYRAYRERQFERYAELAAQGLAEWFVLSCDGVLAADCGLLREQASPGATARFQRVAVHPQWRRRGLAGALVHAVTTHALYQWQAARVLMIANPDDVAITIYRSLGYAELEREWLFQRLAPGDGGD